MARTFTVGTLITRCKQRCDMENQGLISDSEWKGLLSTVYGEFYSLIVESGLRYFETEATISTDGSASYVLPADHLATIGVDYLVNGGGTRRALREMMVQERNVFTGTSGDSARAYALVGANLEIYPTAPSGQSYYHVYVPQPADLSAAADETSIDVITPDGENFVVWGVAVLALSKEESDVTVAMAERERMRTRVTEWATLRSFNTPRRHVVDAEPWLEPDPGDYWGRGGF